MITELLCQSCQSGDLERVLSIAGRGANLNFNTGEMNRTPLHFAVEYGRIEIVESLVHHGAFLDAVDKFGFTPLSLAVIQNGFHQRRCSPKTSCEVIDENTRQNVTSYRTIISLLIQLGADIGIKDYTGNSIFHTSASFGTLESLFYILEEYSEQGNPRQDKQKRPENSESQKDRSISTRQCLLRSPGWGYLTPLHYACCSAQLSTVEFLLMCGAGCDPNVIDAYGWTPLHWAARNGSIDVCLLLLRHGADPSVQDMRGLSPPFIATLFHHDSLSRLIAEYRTISQSPSDHSMRRVLSSCSSRRPSIPLNTPEASATNCTALRYTSNDPSFLPSLDVTAASSSPSLDAIYSDDVLSQRDSCDDSCDAFTYQRKLLIQDNPPDDIAQPTAYHFPSTFSNGFYTILPKVASLVCLWELFLRCVFLITCVSCFILGSLQLVFSHQILWSFLISWLFPLVVSVLVHSHEFIVMVCYVQKSLWNSIPFGGLHHNTPHQKDVSLNMMRQSKDLRKETADGGGSLFDRMKPLKHGGGRSMVHYAGFFFEWMLYSMTAAAACVFVLMLMNFILLAFPLWFLSLSPFKKLLRLEIFKNALLRKAKDMDALSVLGEHPYSKTALSLVSPNKLNTLGVSDQLCLGVESYCSSVKKGGETKKNKWKYEGTSGGMIADMQHGQRGIRFQSSGDNSYTETNQQVSTVHHTTRSKSPTRNAQSLVQYSCAQSCPILSNSDTNLLYDVGRRGQSSLGVQQQSLLSYSYSTLSDSRFTKNQINCVPTKSLKFSQPHEANPPSLVSQPVLPGVFVPKMKASPSSIVKGAFEGKYPGTHVWFTVLRQRLEKLAQRRCRTPEDSVSTLPSSTNLHADFYQDGTGRYFELSFLEEQVFEWFIQRLQRRQFEIVCHHWKLYSLDSPNPPYGKHYKKKQSYQRLIQTTSHMAHVPNMEHWVHGPEQNETEWTQTLIQCHPSTAVSLSSPIFQINETGFTEFSDEDNSQGSNDESSSLVSMLLTGHETLDERNKKPKYAENDMNPSLVRYLPHDTHRKNLTGKMQLKNLCTAKTTSCPFVSPRHYTQCNSKNHKGTPFGENHPAILNNFLFSLGDCCHDGETPHHSRDSSDHPELHSGCSTTESPSPSFLATENPFRKAVVPEGSDTWKPLKYPKITPNLTPLNTVHKKNCVLDLRATIPCDISTSLTHKISSSFSTPPDLAIKRSSLPDYHLCCRMAQSWKGRQKERTVADPLNDSTPCSSDSQADRLLRDQNETINNTVTRKIFDVQDENHGKAYPTDLESVHNRYEDLPPDGAGTPTTAQITEDKTNVDVETDFFQDLKWEGDKSTLNTDPNPLASSNTQQGYSFQTAWSIAVALLPFNKQLFNSDYVIFQNNSFTMISNQVETSRLTDFQAILDHCGGNMYTLNERTYLMSKVECPWILNDLYVHLISEAANRSNMKGSALLWKREFHKLAGYLDLTSVKMSSLWPVFYSSSTRVNREAMKTKDIQNYLPGYSNPSPALCSPNMNGLMPGRLNSKALLGTPKTSYLLGDELRTPHDKSRTEAQKEQIQCKEDYSNSCSKVLLFEKGGSSETLQFSKPVSSPECVPYQENGQGLEEMTLVWMKQISLIQLVFGAMLYLFPLSLVIQWRFPGEPALTHKRDSVMDFVMNDNFSEWIHLLQSFFQDTTKTSFSILYILAHLSGWSTIASLIAYAFLVAF